ncbi:MAG: amino acid permease [Marinilabiliales bacterium]|nr:MAG: amino acid permease [Marinilabiliales bacterium]
MSDIGNKARRFGTAPVFFTSIATILGAILFLRFGFATGTLGFWGVLLIIIVSHLVTVPAALAMSEIATNQKVEGGGVYYIISRSFGLNIGATIGITLFFAQAISVAFYVIAFTETFEPLFNFFYNRFNIAVPRQLVSVPLMLVLSAIILKRGANLGIKALYFVVAILFISILCFFLGKTDYEGTTGIMNFTFRNQPEFYIILAIIFPAFTGITVGVGLSGDLKNPGKSIPLGTIAATIIGMLVYIFVTWKLAISATPQELIDDQFIMSRIALFGPIVIPLGLAASTLSSALGSVLVAPRTLQALGADRSLPTRKLNYIFSRGRGETNEPYNATLITCSIAMVFVILGNLNVVAQVITMFFLITYSSLCLISFLNHFGSDPSYRPLFRSRWYLSLAGFLISIWLMLMINITAALTAFLIITILYSSISNHHKDRKGLEVIFQGVFFQLSRKIQIYLQKSKKIHSSSWRPAVVCVSKNTFDRTKPFELITWISHRYGFATYIHLIEGYFSKSSHEKSAEKLERLIQLSELEESNVYVDTLISPSYTSAIAQIIQLPGISGMENNMALFEYEQGNTSELLQIIDNYSLVKSGNFDVCIYANSHKAINFKQGIHVWIKSTDSENANLMILISYIILGHPDWKKGFIKIFSLCKETEKQETWNQIVELIRGGRLPISLHNIEIITMKEDVNPKTLINERSANAGLTLIGFRGEMIKQSGEKFFLGYEGIGNVIFVNANKYKEIK